MQGAYHRIASPQLGRRVHIWTYGWYGMPVLVFPSAAGMAHEWQAHGMVETLAPLLRAGKIKLYCPESNVAEAWTRKEGSPEWRVSRHLAYERFVLETLLPAIYEDCRTDGIPIATTGCSLGAMYAANFALKHPTVFRRAICMSGRYELRGFTDGYDSLDVYYNNPLAFVSNLHGAPLDRIQQHTRLTLVCGRGRFEGGCIEETLDLAGVFRAKGIPHECDIWGHDSAHDWDWWRRQAAYHFGRAFA
jgi:esterase/lipase superfamily enzyme